MTITNKAVSVTTSPTSLQIGTVGASSVAVYNDSSAVMYIGGSSVASSGVNKGAPIAASMWSPSFDLIDDEVLYATVATGTGSAIVIESGLSQRPLTASQSTPAIPLSVRIGPFAYVVTVDDAVCDAQAVVQHDDVDGFTDFRKRSIFLRSGLAFDYSCDTLLHEILHAVNDMAGVESEPDDEKRTRAQSPALLDVLRRNPDLVAYLVG